ncbi:MAG TPA: A24 family peptidase [Gaiellales bacterium]|nr:A24 family peptidase [Gaiellales bacterium]
METVLPMAGIGLALGWPIEWTIQRFPRGGGTIPSRRRLAVLAAVTACLFGLLAARIGIHPQLVPAMLLTALVVPAAAIDLHHRIIPNAINLPGAAIVYVAAVAAQPDRWLELLAGGLGGLLFLGVAWRVSPAGMGLGDVKMALMIGLALGASTLVALFAAFVLALLPSLAVLARHGLRSGRKVGLPFGPFLAAGAVVGLLWGPQLLDWYVNHGG